MRKLDPKKHPKLIAFLEKTQKVLKTVAVICFSLVIVLCVFFYTKACADKNTAQLISASAEEASTASRSTYVESGIDSTQYPSANLIPYPYFDGGKVIGDVTYTVTENYGLNINGTAADSASSYTIVSNLSVPYDFVTLSVAGFEPNSSSHYSPYYVQAFVGAKQVASSSAYYGHEVVTIDLSGFSSSDKVIVLLRLFVRSGVTVDNVTLYPMLNVGEVAYPFMPNLDGVYSQGYNSGYEAGETDGYNQGKEDGLDRARAGYWNDCNVYVNLTGTSNGTTVVDYFTIAPTITSNGIDLTNIYTEINTKYPNFSVIACTFGLTFASPVYFDTLTVRCIGDTSVIVEDGLIVYVYDPVTSSTTGIEARFNLIDGSDNVSGLSIHVGSAEELYGKQLSHFGLFSIQNISQFKNLRFYSSDTMASLNYQAGYQAGLNDNMTYQEAYGSGFDNGYNVGKSDGFQEGFNQSKMGGFGWLISSVQSFLSVNFFGDFGIGSLLYVALGVTFVSLFLKFFAGG